MSAGLEPIGSCIDGGVGVVGFGASVVVVGAVGVTGGGVFFPHAATVIVAAIAMAADTRTPRLISLSCAAI